MSKLYTEEQVKQMIEKSRETGLTAEYLILATTPIELPNDEEILEESKIGGMDTSQGLCFQLGAKWMRDKIKGGEE